MSEMEQFSRETMLKAHNQRIDDTVKILLESVQGKDVVGVDQYLQVVAAYEQTQRELITMKVNDIFFESSKISVVTKQ